MNKHKETKVIFKFLGAELYVNRITANPTTLLGHSTTLTQGALARYDRTRVELKTFTLASGSKSISIDNVALGRQPK